MQKNTRLYQLAHLHVHSPSRIINQNIFNSTHKSEIKQEEQSDRFIVGVKQVKVYRNKIKRKQKLTTGIISTPSQKDNSLNSSELLNSQEVIDCLPKNEYLPKVQQKSKFKQVREAHARHQVEWKRNRNANSEAIMTSINQLKKSLEPRQYENSFHNLRSLQWSCSLRESQIKERKQAIIASKMVVCGIPKKQTEQKWLTSKQNEGYAFQLLPQIFLSKERYSLIPNE